MPLVTLTSDIGQQDYLVGAVKGQLLQVNAAFSLVDITHQLSPFNYQLIILKLLENNYSN